MFLRTTKANQFPIVVQGVNLVVCPMSATALSALRKRHTKIKRGAEIVDGVELTKDMFSRIVISWDAKDLESQQPIPCDVENKRKICEFNGDFVAEVLEATDEEDKSQRQAEEGNSGAGVSGNLAPAE